MSWVEDLCKLCNKVGLLEEINEKKIYVFLFYASVLKIDFFQYLGYTDINIDDCIFSKTDPKKSHLPLKVVLGQFCTLVWRQHCLPFLLLWNSLSIPWNQGKDCVAQSVDPGKSVLLSVLSCLFTAMLSVTNERSHSSLAGCWEMWDSHCLLVRRTVLELEVCTLGTMATFCLKNMIRMQILSTTI